MRLIILLCLLLPSLAVAENFQVSCPLTTAAKVFPGQYNYECTGVAAPYACCTAAGVGSCRGAFSGYINRQSATFLNHGANDIFLCETINCASCSTTTGFKLPQNIIFRDDFSRASLCCVAAVATTTLSVIVK